MNIRDVVKKNSAEQPDGIALVVNNKNISWCQLQQRIMQFSCELQKFNPQRLMCYLPSSESGVALLLASTNLPIETIIVPDYYSQEMAIRFMKEFGASHLVTIVNDQIEVLDHSRSKLPHDSLPEAYLCLLTSGTTGLPKCAKHCWSDFCKSIKTSQKLFKERWILGFQITHFAGMRVFLQSILNGGTLVIPDNLKPNIVLANIITHKVSFLNCTPTFMRQLLMTSKPQDWSNAELKHITLGGEIIDQSLLDLIKTYVPTVKITHVYGSTELGALIIVRDGKEGFPAALLDNVKFKVVDGELLVNKASLGPNAAALDNWIGTQDSVYIAEDRVKFSGRKCDVINVGGYKVDPYLVEQCIRQLPYIMEVAVLSQDNPISGKIIKAKILLHQSRTEQDARLEIIQHCKDKLPSYMIPRLFEFTKKMMLTETMKLLRREVNEL